MYAYIKILCYKNRYKTAEVRFRLWVVESKSAGCLLDGRIIRTADSRAGLAYYTTLG